MTLFKAIKKFIFPSRCVLCDTLLPFGDGIENDYLCNDCRYNIEFIKKPTCKKCGAMVCDDDETLCERCKKVFRKYYDFGFGLCRYNDFVKESLHRIKYKGKKEYIDFYGRCIAKVYKENFRKLNIDCFIPVPIHRSRLIERSYNQATELAYSISDELLKSEIEIPVNTSIVKRKKKTKVLNKLNDVERNSELKNAFTVRRDDSISSVMIVDDIYTTGATIDAIASCLKESGVQKIYFTTIAIVDNL